MSIQLTDSNKRRIAKEAIAHAFGPDCDIIAMGETNSGQTVVHVNTGRKYGQWAVLYVSAAFDGPTAGLVQGFYTDRLAEADAEFIKRAMR